MKLVISPAVDEARLTAIQESAGAMQVVNCEDPQQALREMPDADAFFGKMTPELLSAAGQLKWVQSPTASLEHYLFPELIEHPCQLSNMRGLFSDVIADHVFGYLLCAVRNLHIYLRRQQRHEWKPVGGEEERASFATGPSEPSAIDSAHRRLADCTLGMVGVGEIGAEICRRGVAVGMSVRGVDPAPRELDGALIEDISKLPELLEWSDFVVIAAPHTPQTAGLFGGPQFDLMKRTAWLINIGRGAIVQLDELVNALQTGEIAGAALDVFETEPLPAGSPLWDMENVIVTPHVAAASERVPERHLEKLLANVRRFSQGKPVENLVNKRIWC